MNMPRSTAIDYGIAVPEAAPAKLLAELGYFVFLLLVFVTLKPFAIRDMSILPLGTSGNGTGDTIRQVLYLGTFAWIAASAFQVRGAQILRAAPLPLLLLLAWCLATSLWAGAPMIAMRRAALEIVIVLSATLSIQSLGPVRAIAILRTLLAAILIVNCASILIVHQAVHLPDESDQQLVGNWRGLYYHKNIAGAVTVITALLFFFHAMQTRRLLHWLIFAMGIGFTLMTRSKTSIGLLPIAIGAGILFSQVRRDSLGRWILLVAGGCTVIVAVVAAVIDFDAIERFLTDPTELTGRVAIWKGEFAYIRDHLFFGSGFGSFADTGNLSPLHNYVLDKWVQGEAHGHNAYLQMYVTIGGVGFALAMIAFVIQPALSFRRIAKPADMTLFAPLFAVFVFILLHNFVESDFLEGDGPAWVAFVLILACLHTRETRYPKPEVARSLQWSAP
jgi:exopolysaccharide production protein ExoQ